MHELVIYIVKKYIAYDNENPYFNIQGEFFKGNYPDQYYKRDIILMKEGSFKIKINLDENQFKTIYNTQRILYISYINTNIENNELIIKFRNNSTDFTLSLNDIKILINKNFRNFSVVSNDTNFKFNYKSIRKKNTYIIKYMYLNNKRILFTTPIDKYNQWCFYGLNMYNLYKLSKK